MIPDGAGAVVGDLFQKRQQHPVVAQEKALAVLRAIFYVGPTAGNGPRFEDVDAYRTSRGQEVGRGEARQPRAKYGDPR